MNASKDRFHPHLWATVFNHSYRKFSLNSWSKFLIIRQLPLVQSSLALSHSYPVMIQDINPLSEVNPSWRLLFSRLDNSSSFSLAPWPHWWPSAELAQFVSIFLLLGRPTHNTAHQMASCQSWIISQNKPSQVQLVSCSASYSMYWTWWGSRHPSSPVCPDQQPCPPLYQLIPQFAGPLPPIYSATTLQVWWKKWWETVSKLCNFHCPPLVHSTSALPTESSDGGQL